MAQTSFIATDFPAITRNTLESALKDTKAQYLNNASQFIPQVVYLKELPSYDEFFAKFLIPNQLCVLAEVATRQWHSRQEWVCQDGSPNMDILQSEFGNATVPVANCKSKEYSAHAKQEMKMSDFLNYWRQYREAGHPQVENSLYLKDWHFTRDFPDYEAYRTCSFFRSDWMNEFWDVRKDIDDDYRFVYMGPKNTWTPFHADVFRSFSWSANICGRKRWIFFPPGEEDHLKDIHNSLVYDVTATELQDAMKFPNAHKVQHRIEIIQHPGETIFVPSGWHHQVENLEDTISINHNWLNGCNVRQCWAHLKTSLGDVEHEISDCRDMDGWDQQCQVILRALTGLGYEEFFHFMESIARRRIHGLHTWKQKAQNSTSLCSDLAALHCSTNGQPEPSESSQSDCENEGKDTNRASDFCQLGEGVLNLSEGEDLNCRGVQPPHWNSCNVNHALFDVAAVAMVLQDMKQCMSVKPVPQCEAENTETTTCRLRTETQMLECEKENQPCSQDMDKNCPETSELPKTLPCRIESLLKETSQCLSVFGLDGSWEL